MQKIERNFLIIVVFIIIIIIWFAAYWALCKRDIDRNAYVVLLNWSWLLNQNELIINEKEKLEVDDLVKTTTEDALAVIQWWDWSVTRIWWNSELRIDSLYVSQNEDKIKISFELLKWKSWSNIVSFIPDDSYFIQRFMDTEAAVRWTVFNVDLDNNYIYVIKNKVQVTKDSWETLLVEEKNPLDLKTFTFIRLDEFIKSIRDTTFDTLNRVLDSELYQKMQEDLVKRMDNTILYTIEAVDYITDTERNEFYQRLLASYQDVNFLWADAKAELYEYKIKLKEQLIEYAPEKEKQVLLESYVNDFKDSIKLNNNELIEWMINAFMKNKNDLTETMQSSIWQYTLEIPLPAWLKESFIQSINDLKLWFNVKQ